MLHFWTKGSKRWWEDEEWAAAKGHNFHWRTSALGFLQQETRKKNKLGQLKGRNRRNILVPWELQRKSTSLNRQEKGTSAIPSGRAHVSRFRDYRSAAANKKILPFPFPHPTSSQASLAVFSSPPDNEKVNNGPCAWNSPYSRSSQKPLGF